MAEAFFTFDTNIEAVVRRVRTGFQQLSQEVARNATSQAGAAPGSEAAQQLERRLSTSIRNAARELAAVRDQFEGALRQAGAGGTAARPNDLSLKSEGERVLNRLRGQLINDLTDFGRQFDLPEEQVRSTIVQGVGQLQAGFKALFLAARDDLRRVQSEVGSVATTKTFYGSSGLDTTRGLRGDLKEDIQRETRNRTITTGPQDLLDVEMSQALREARAVFRNAVSGAVDPADARATAEALDAALKQAIRNYVDAVRRTAQRASGFGLDAPRADEGLRGLTDQALRARQRLGVSEIPIARGAFPTLGEVKPVREELQTRALESAHRSAARAAEEQAAASRRAAEADDAEATASRRAAVATSQARAGLTDAQIEAGRRDDQRAAKGAEIERRLAAGDPRVTYGRQRSEVVEFTPEGPQVYQISRRALGAGSQLDPEGRRHTLATRLAEDAEANATKEFLEAQKRRADQTGERVADASKGLADRAEYLRLLKEETKEQALTLASIQRGREQAQVAERLRREVAEGLSRQVASNRFLTPRGLEDRGGQRVYAPDEENAYRLNERLGQRVVDGQARSLGNGLYLDQALGGFVQVANNKAQVLQGAITAQQATRLNAAIERLRREAEEASRRVGQTAPAGGGGGGRNGVGGRFLGGFSEGFNSAGFAGGKGEGDIIENLSRTAGLEARFFVTYRALLLVQQGVRDTVEEYLRLSEAERNLEIALGGGVGVSNELRGALTDVASVAGESVSTAMDVAARGVRAFSDASTQSATEIARIASEFAHASETLSVIAQQSLEESANEIVATAQSFDLGDFGNIAEVVAEARRLGGDPDEISSGLANIGVAAREAGLDVRETAAIISAAVAQTGQSGQAVATRLSRVFNTLRGSTGRNLLSGLGVDIEQQPIDQLRELANVYGELSELDQRAIASRLAGVSNIREFTVLLESLEDGGRVQQVVAEGFGQGGEAISEYNRRLESAAGQVQLIVGQVRELQQGLVEAGALDVFGAALQLAKPFLQTINDLLGAFNSIVGVVPGLNRVVTIIGQAYLVNRLLVRLRQESIATTGQEVAAEDTLTGARQREKVALLDLQAGLLAMSRLRSSSAAAYDAETSAVTRNTLAKRANAGVALPPPVAGTGIGAVPPVPPPTPGYTPGRAQRGTLPGPPRDYALRGGAATAGRITGFLRSAGPAIAITAAVVAFQSLSDALGRVQAATEGAAEAQEGYIQAQIRLSSSALSESADSLRNQAAQIRDSAGGFTGSIANFFASLEGESLNDRAGRLESQANQAERDARERREVELDRVSTLGEGETIFGAFLDGAEELRIGLETLDAAGANAVTKVRQVVAVLEDMAAIEPGDFTVLDRFATEDLAQQLSAGITTLLGAAVEDSINAGEDGKRFSTRFSDKEGGTSFAGLGEAGAAYNTVQEVDEAIRDLRFEQQLLLQGLDTQGNDRLGRLDDVNAELERLRGLREILGNEELVEGIQSEMAAIVERLAGPDGVLSTDQYQDVVDQAVAYVESIPGGESIDSDALSVAIRQYLEGIVSSTAPQLNEEQFREAAEAVLQNLNAIPDILQLTEGRTPVQSLQEAASYIETLRAVSESEGFEFTEELELAYAQIIRQLEDAQAAVAEAQRNLESARLPEADVAGQRALELEGLEAELDTARSRNDPEAIANAQAAIALFARETAEVERERLAAVAQSQLDIRDADGRLQASIDAATARLSATAQFDSDGNTTQAYAEASDEVARLLLEQANQRRETALAFARAAIDPRDDVGNARQDLADAQANLDAQLEGSQEFAEAEREVTEAKLALARAERELASAIARSTIDPRDEVALAAQDIRDAAAAVEAEIPGTVGWFNAMDELREANIRQRRILNGRQDAQRRASLDPRDTLGEAEADVKAAQDELDAQLPGQEAYYEAERSLAEALLARGERQREYASAAARAQIDPRDDVALAEQDVREATANLAAQVPGTLAFFEAQRELVEAMRGAADTQRRLADAIDLASVDPGDEIAEAEVRVRIARRELEAALPGTIGYYEALRSLNEAQHSLAEAHEDAARARRELETDPSDTIGRAANRIEDAERAVREAIRGSREFYEALAELRDAQEQMAEEQRALDAARDLARLNPGDEVGEAAARLRAASRELRAAQVGTRDYYEALRELKEAQRALAEAQDAVRDAADLSRVNPGDDVGRARAELRIAERALRRTARGTREFYEALAAFKEAQEALEGAIRARDDARDLANVFPGSALQGATAQLRVAERALRDAERGTAEYYDALAGLRQAQVDLARAQSDARGTSRLLSTDLTNPIAAARAQIANLSDMLHSLAQLGAPGDVLDEIRLQIKQAQDSLESTQFSEKLSTLRDLVDIGAISDQQYENYLKAEKNRLLSIRNRTYEQNKQLIEIEKALQAANAELAGEFNIGNIRTPTPFEVRRRIEQAVPGLTAIQDAADSFGTGGRNDPIGNLVDGSTQAVNNLAGHVSNFGNLVASIFAQLGIGSDGGLLGGGSGGASGGGGYTGPQSAGGGYGTTRPTDPWANPPGFEQRPYQSPFPGGGWNPTTTVTTTSPGPSVRSSYIPPESRTYDQRMTTSSVVQNTYNVQVDGADFGKVKTMFERMMGERPMQSRSAGNRKF